MEEGVNVPLGVTVEVQANVIAAAAVREVQMQAAIQHLMKENAELRQSLVVPEEKFPAEVPSQLG